MMPPAVTALALASLVMAAPVMAAIGRAPSPPFALLSDVRATWRSDPAPAFAMHESIGFMVRGEQLPDAPRLDAVFPREWLTMSEYWREGGERPVWFFADPGRTDLTLVDPASRRLVGEYRWSFDPDRFLSGARPPSVDWYEVAPPAWVLGPGFSLTPEVRGASGALGRGLTLAPIEGWVRRSALHRPTVLLIGGWHAGTTGQSARLRISVDEVELARFEVPPGRSFLQLHRLLSVTLPGADSYARLRVDATPVAGGARPRIEIDQFDLQPATSIVFGLGAGWSPLEPDPSGDGMVRWPGPSAVLRVHDGGRDIVLTVTGELLPGRFRRPPLVDIRAGDALIGQAMATPAFTWTVSAAEVMLRRGGGEISLVTDLTFAIPEEERQGRRLPGLKIREVTVSALDDATPQR